MVEQTQRRRRAVRDLWLAVALTGSVGLVVSLVVGGTTADLEHHDAPSAAVADLGIPNLDGPGISVQVRPALPRAFPVTPAVELASGPLSLLEAPAASARRTPTPPTAAPSAASLAPAEPGVVPAAGAPTLVAAVASTAARPAAVPVVAEPAPAVAPPAPIVVAAAEPTDAPRPRPTARAAAHAEAARRERVARLVRTPSAGTVTAASAAAATPSESKADKHEAKAIEKAEKAEAKAERKAAKHSR